MKRRRVILLCVALVSAFTLTCILWPSEPEPSYKGKKLSQWLREYSLPRYGNPEPTEAAEAIRHIGTNGIPYMIKWMRSTPSPWRVRLASKIRRSSPSTCDKLADLLFSNKRLQLGDAAVYGFAILGKDGVPA